MVSAIEMLLSKVTLRLQTLVDRITAVQLCNCNGVTLMWDNCCRGPSQTNCLFWIHFKSATAYLFADGLNTGEQIRSNYHRIASTKMNVKLKVICKTVPICTTLIHGYERARMHAHTHTHIHTVIKTLYSSTHINAQYAHTNMHATTHTDAYCYAHAA